MRSALLLATFVVVVLLVPSTAGAAAAARCPAKAHTVARAGGAVLWVRAGTLYGCSTRDDLKPIPRRLGPWRGGRVVFQGVQAAWTVAQDDGTERLWAADVTAGPSHAWLRDRPLVPAAGDAPAREARVRRFVERGDVLAYVTTAGDVALAANGGAVTAEPVGGLPALPRPVRRQLLVGSYPDADVEALAASLELTTDGVCGGTVDYALRFAPEGTPLGLDLAADTGNAAVCD